MREPRSYARRFFRKALHETAAFTYRKLLVGMCMAVVVRLALWQFHNAKLTWADVWADLLIVVGSYAVVVLASFVVNLFRAPALLDNERAKEISDLSAKLELLRSTTNHRQIKTKLAALMRQERELRDALKSASDDSQYTELIRKTDEWVNGTAALLNEAELPTDAEAFVQIGCGVLSSEQLARFAHVAEWKRKDIARLALYRQMLDQIRDSRRL